MTNPYDSPEVRLKALEVRMEEQHKAMLAEIAHGRDLILEKLKPLDELQKTVKRHDTQISIWRGALILLGIAWTGMLSYLGLRHG